jgi:hypothetical protein
MEELYQTIVDFVYHPENFVPRDYQTIGGMWTVDKYSRNGISYRIFDDGYGSEIFTENLRVRCICLGTKPEFTIVMGELGMLKAMAREVIERMEK